jgi:hypothetical protein
MAGSRFSASARGMAVRAFRAIALPITSIRFDVTPRG